MGKLTRPLEPLASELTGRATTRCTHMPARKVTHKVHTHMAVRMITPTSSHLHVGAIALVCDQDVCKVSG